MRVEDVPKSGITYLASPYTGSLILREWRYESVAGMAAKLFQMGFAVYSPIVSWHHIALRYDLPQDWLAWRSMDEKFLRVSERMIVLALEGWDHSKGVTAEIEICKKQEMTVYLWNFLSDEVKILWEDEG